MAERHTEGASVPAPSFPRFNGAAAKSAVPKIAPLLKTNTLSEIPSHGVSFKPVVSPSPPESAERVAAVRSFSRVASPASTLCFVRFLLRPCVF